MHLSSMSMSTSTSTRSTWPPLCLVVTFLFSLVTAQNATRSSKRGLVYVNSQASETDAEVLTSSWTDLTWYYNYVDKPTSVIPSDLDFVPMLWGVDDDPTDTTFLDSITEQLSSGTKITHVLAYNEPDGTHHTGGSNIDPAAAAAVWMHQIAPLRTKHNLKVGLPAVTGSPSGFTWLRDFNTSCEMINPDPNPNFAGCVADFIPIHWYGNFEGLASHMGQVRAAYPTLPIWVTEYALAGAEDVAAAQAFYNISAKYFDRIDYVERYSYFGSFRSTESNVGRNSAMLNGEGKLTDIGSWYLGGTATGVEPDGGSIEAGGTVSNGGQGGGSNNNGNGNGIGSATNNRIDNWSSMVMMFGCMIGAVILIF